jgi:hypothetical protein
MDENLSRQILDDLIPSLEAMDTKTSALLQLLKDKGVATDKELATCLEQAGNASNVRWRAARVRLDYLLSSATKPPDAKPPDQAAEKKSPPPAENRDAATATDRTNKDKDDKDEDQEDKSTEPAGKEETKATEERAKEKASPEPTGEKKEKDESEAGKPAEAA